MKPMDEAVFKRFLSKSCPDHLYTTLIAQLVCPLSQNISSLGTPYHQTSFATSAWFPLRSVRVTTPPSIQNNANRQTQSTTCTYKALHAVSIVLGYSRPR